MVSNLNEILPHPRVNRFGKKLVKIAFTGGPCAGKSTAIEEIAEKIGKDLGNEWQVFKAAEAASLLYSGGVARHLLNDEQLEQWQLDMLCMIIRIEAVFEKIAEHEVGKSLIELEQSDRFQPNRHTVILCDRGALDPKVFTPEAMWKRILQKLSTSEEILFDRYNQVIQLHTAPRCNYTYKTNRLRREDWEGAEKINREFTRLKPGDTGMERASKLCEHLG